jgi:hypothetical protein
MIKKKYNMTSTIEELDVRNYIREQLEGIIYILGSQISVNINREWAVDLIKEEVKRI